MPTKQFDYAALARQQVREERQATTSREEAPQAHEATETPETPPKPARERRRAFETPTRQVHREFGKRERQKQARDYAEQWWQALRRWHYRTNSDLVYPSRAAHTSGAYFEPVTMGQSSAGNMISDVLYTIVLTPIGWVSEKRLGRVLGQYPALASLRGGAGLASLVHGSGQGWNGAEARENAVCVLEIAAQLEDERANHHLDVLKLREN